VGGGRLQWEGANPLRVGDAVRRISRIASVSRKSGRSGDLVFVTVNHQVHNASGLALTEEHDIVYRAAAQPGEAPPPPVAAPADAPWQRELTPDEVLLFRYSALTFNGHRIHYDRTYVTGTEGYPGLIVHGPLIATLLLDLVRRRAPAARVRRFEFKAMRPAFDGRPLRLNGQPGAEGVQLWAQDHEGWLAIESQRGDRRMKHQHRHDKYQDIRDAVRDLCKEFPDEYHRKVDEKRAYPEAFVEALTKAGWLAALIPQEYGGSGLGLAEASVIMEEINRSGGNSGACHGQMYNMGTLLRHGSDAQKKKYLPRSRRANGAFSRWASPSPSTGTDTTKIKTTAVKKGDRYVINGQKVWISRIQHSDFMILLARTDAAGRREEEVRGHVDLHGGPARGRAVGHDGAADPEHGQPRDQRLFFENLEIPART
jgi:hydroxyacyl-ACP dehydratase HTD2-like protein with hotdog domain